MSSIVDAQGRLFGRVNVVDALCVLFLLGLVPAAYVSWLLFRPATPRIRSIEPSTITWAEQRIAGGLPIRLKVKVRGDHLAPLLRATIDNVPAIGFTFETPNSADVIIGENVPFGTHDLILYDGIQEVARAPGSIKILPAPTAPVRAIGRLVQLDETTANSLREGQRFEIDGHPAAEIIALGGVEPDRAVVKQGSGRVEPAIAGSWRRDSIIAIHCELDPDERVCHVGKTTVGETADAVIELPGATPVLRMLVSGIVPEAAPRAATVRVRIPEHAELAGIVRAGDRDARWPSIDSRAAVVTTVSRSATTGVVDVTLRLGIDRGTGGWRYHGLSLQPGGAFPFVTERYIVEASLIDMAIDEQ